MTDSGRAALYEALMASYDAAAQRASAIVRARPEARRLTDDQFYSSERLNLQVARLHRELFAAEHQPEHVAFFYDRASGHGQRKNTNRGRARLGDRGLPKRQRQLDSALRRLVAGQTVAVNVWWDGGQWLVWPRGFQPRDFAELTTSCRTAAEDAGDGDCRGPIGGGNAVPVPVGGGPGLRVPGPPASNLRGNTGGQLLADDEVA